MPTKRTSKSSSSLTRKLSLPPSSLAMCFRHIKPSWRHYIDYAMLCAAEDKDKEMRKIVDAYNRLLPRERTTISPEQLCDLAAVPPKVLFAAVCGKLFERSQQESALITAVSLPKVVERTMQQASTKSGVRDREMVHKHTGFLPTPKGPGVQVNVNNRTAIASAGDTKIMSLPSLEQDVMQIDDAVALPALPAVDAGKEDK